MKKFSIMFALLLISISACSQIKDNDAAKTARTRAAQDRIDGSNRSGDSITKELNQ